MNGEAVEAEATFLGNPYSLGPVVWYDANDIDGDWVNDPTPPSNVSLWKDKSGNSHHAIAEVGKNRHWIALEVQVAKLLSKSSVEDSSK